MIVNVRVFVDTTQVANPANILNEVTQTINQQFERVPGVGLVDVTEVTLEVSPVEEEEVPAEPVEENDV